MKGWETIAWDGNACRCRQQASAMRLHNKTPQIITSHCLSSFWRILGFGLRHFPGGKTHCIFGCRWRMFVKHILDDLVSQNKAIKYSFTQWHMHRIHSLGFINLFCCYSSTGEYASKYLLIGICFPGLIASLSTCLSVRRSQDQEFIKEKEGLTHWWRQRSQVDNTAYPLYPHYQCERDQRKSPGNLMSKTINKCK